MALLSKQSCSIVEDLGFCSYRLHSCARGGISIEKLAKTPSYEDREALVALAMQEPPQFAISLRPTLELQLLHNCITSSSMQVEYTSTIKESGLCTPLPPRPNFASLASPHTGIPACPLWVTFQLFVSVNV